MKPHELSVSSSPGTEDPLLSQSDIHMSKRNFKITSSTEEERTQLSILEEPSRRQSHHRKKMMEKWMNLSFGRNGKRNHPPRCHDSKDVSDVKSLPVSNLPPIPADPRKWTSQHVLSWLDVVAAKHAIKVDHTDFRMNGRALCLMKRDGFLRRIPEKGAILYDDFRGRVRRYMTACRRRVRTTLTSGGMPMPVHMPHIPLSSIPAATQLHMVPQMYASRMPMAPPTMCAAPSPMRAVPSATHSVPSTTRTAPSTVYTTPSQTGTASSIVHTVPSTAHATPPSMPVAPFYRFVPLYRTMKVVGHFQPLALGMPGAQLPGVIPPLSQSQTPNISTTSGRHARTSAQPTPPTQRRIKSEPPETS